MKKTLKYAKDVTVGDLIKITGYSFEVTRTVVIDSGVKMELYCWARPAKTAEIYFSDPTFPVTVR